MRYAGVLMKRMTKTCWILCVLMLSAACGALDTAAPTTTPETIAWQLATIGPTATLSQEDRAATQAAALSPTAPPPTTTPSPTPYVGIFLGEADISDYMPPQEQFIMPTPRSQPALQRVCALPISDIFETGWETSTAAVNGLRCPIQESFGFSGRVQIFEGGVMYLREETREVWAIAFGSFTSGGRFWYMENPPDLPNPQVNAPAGRRTPTGAFGSMWSIVPEARAALGFATTQSQSIDINLQRFEGGTLFRDMAVGQVFALLVDGSAFGPY